MVAAPESAIATASPGLEHLRNRLAEWLAPRVGARAVQIGQLEPVHAGVSNETRLVQAAWRAGDSIETREFVLRLPPRPESRLFPDPDLGRQHELLRALHRWNGVRVPDCYWYESDPSILGRPFLMMQRLHGRAPPTRHAGGPDWFSEASAADRAQLWYSAVNELARIARAPATVTALLEHPEDGATGIEQQLRHWSRAAVRAAPEGVPEILEYMGDWLFQNRPNQFENQLSWGHAGIGSMMFDDNFQVVGVLDWDLASLAGPMADLAWWLFTDEQRISMRQPRLDGIGDRKATIELWEATSRQPVRDLHWHEVFAGYRLCVLGLRQTHLSSRKGSASGARMRNSLISRTCALLEVEVPEAFRT